MGSIGIGTEDMVSESVLSVWVPKQGLGIGSIGIGTIWMRSVSVVSGLAGNFIYRSGWSGKRYELLVIDEELGSVAWLMFWLINVRCSLGISSYGMSPGSYDARLFPLDTLVCSLGR